MNYINYKRDCIVCVLYPLLKLGSISGTFVISFSCPHITKNQSCFPRFSKSNVYILISLILALPVMINIFFNIYKIKYLLGDDEVNILSALNEVFISIGAFGFCMTRIIKHKKLLLELRGFSTIINNRKLYGFTTLLSYRVTKIFMLESYLLASIVVTAEFSLAVYLLWYIVTFQQHSSFYIFEMIMFGWNNYILGVNFFHSLLASLIYKKLLKKCLKRIKVAMIKRSELQFNVINKQSDSVFLQESIIKLKCLYSSLIYNFDQINTYTHPAFLIWWLVVLALFISDFYLIVLTFIDNNTPDVFLFLRAYINVVGLLVYLATVADINSVVSKKDSFLLIRK